MKQIYIYIDKYMNIYNIYISEGKYKHMHHEECFHASRSFQISYFILSVPDLQKTTKTFEYVEDHSQKARIASPMRCITFNTKKKKIKLNQ